MKYHISLRVLSVTSFLYLVSRIPDSDAIGQCKSQESIFSKALKGHTINKFHVNRADICITSCQIEPRCRSINYVMGENICELNNRSKEVRPEYYVTDPRRIYMTVPFNKGKCSFYFKLLIASRGGGGVVKWFAAPDFNLELPGSIPPPHSFLDLLAVVQTSRPCQLVGLLPVGILFARIVICYAFLPK